MPRPNVEPIRRTQLAEAAIAEIGAVGNLGVTVSQIARRAGMSSALAHHYLGGKDDILVAAMRHLLVQYASAVRTALAGADGPHARLSAIISASFTPAQFRRETIAVWLNFYVLAQSSDAARRLLHLYHARLRSNLRHALRPLTDDPAAIAERLAAQIDGLYLHESLGRGAPDGTTAIAHMQALAKAELGA